MLASLCLLCFVALSRRAAPLPFLDPLPQSRRSPLLRCSLPGPSSLLVCSAGALCFECNIAFTIARSSASLRLTRFPPVPLVPPSALFHRPFLPLTHLCVVTAMAKLPEIIGRLSMPGCCMAQARPSALPIALNAIERRPQVVSSIQNGESNGGIRKLIPWNARAVFLTADL